MADALGSGPSVLRDVGVQVPPPAPLDFTSLTIQSPISKSTLFYPLGYIFGYITFFNLSIDDSSNSLLSFTQLSINFKRYEDMNR